MPRPCHDTHPPSPGICPWCAWCLLPGEQAARLRLMWGEPEPEPSAIADHLKSENPWPCKGCGKRSPASATSDQVGQLVGAGLVLDQLAGDRPPPCGGCGKQQSHAVAGELVEDKARADELPDLVARRARPRIRPGDLLPGIVDPIPELDPHPLPGGWAFDGRVRERHIRALRELLSRELEPPDIQDRAGIIYVGGGKYWPMIVIGIRMCRRFTDLPIQVWHAGEVEPVNADDIADVPNIAILDSTRVGWTRRRNGGWENKTTAILNSGFTRIVYLDADAYLVGDPTHWLELATASRFAFWCDLPWNDGTVDWGWSGVVNSEPVPPIQGGQLAMDVRLFWRELVISDWINQHSSYFYSHQYGDQDSWRIALAATGGRYHCLGAAGWQPPAFVCRLPEPLVVHRCQAKLWGTGQVQFAHDLPWEGAVREAYNNQVIGRGSAAEIFGRIYAVGMWGNQDSSGAGSTDHESRPFLDLVGVLCRLAGWKQVVDLGCGDGRVTCQLPFAEKIAVDCHWPHIQRLKKDYGDITFVLADLDIDRAELPAGEVAILKDVLHHWPSELVRDWVQWAYESGKWKYVLFAHDCHQNEDGGDCILGGYRALNPGMMPLKGLPLTPVCQYLHKQVLLMECP